MTSERDLMWLERNIAPKILARADDLEVVDAGAGINFLRDCWWAWADAGDHAEGALH